MSKAVRTTITRAAATEAARRFFTAYVRTNRQWNEDCIAGQLPRGYDIDRDASFSGPITVANVTSFIRTHAQAV